VNSLDFYNELRKIKTKNLNQATDLLSLPGTDSFINKCIAMYKDKSNDDFKNSLVVCLLKAFVAKMSGEINPVYSTNVLISIWHSQLHHVKALSFYLETYWDLPFGKFKGEEKTWGETHSFHLISQSLKRR